MGCGEDTGSEVWGGGVDRVQRQRHHGTSSRTGGAAMETGCGLLPLGTISSRSRLMNNNGGQGVLSAVQQA